MMTQTQIVALQSDHAAAVADIHCISQEGTFLTSLGAPFLTLLYATMARSGQGVGLVALQEQTVVGFVVGTRSTGGMFREVVLQQPWHLSRLVLARALQRPQLLWQAAQTLAYPLQQQTDLPAAELLALAVAPAQRNQGIGTKLVLALCRTMTRQQIPAMSVTVDGANTGAQRFYQRHGFVIRHQSQMYGRPMVHLSIDLAA